MVTPASCCTCILFLEKKEKKACLLFQECRLTFGTFLCAVKHNHVVCDDYLMLVYTRFWKYDPHCLSLYSVSLPLVGNGNECH